jgi:hypothetical protein
MADEPIDWRAVEYRHWRDQIRWIEQARARMELRDKVPKERVHYRGGSAARHCGNCAMYHNHVCDLVIGFINSEDVCDLWVTRKTEGRK